jgi:hypothetical protein
MWGKREPVCHVFVGHVASLAVSLYSHLRLWLLACPSTVEDSKEEEENTVPSRLESQGPPASSFTHYEYLCALQQMARTVLCIVHVLYPSKKTLHSHFIERCSTAFSTVESNGLSSVWERKKGFCVCLIGRKRTGGRVSDSSLVRCSYGMSSCSFFPFFCVFPRRAWEVRHAKEIGKLLMKRKKVNTIYIPITRNNHVGGKGRNEK